MRLRRPCEHDLYDAHGLYSEHADTYPSYKPLTQFEMTCPGGEFLPEDAVVIVKVDGEWPSEFVPVIAVALRIGAKKGRTVPQLEINEQQGYVLAEAALIALAALAPDQVGEPGTPKETK